MSVAAKSSWFKLKAVIIAWRKVGMKRGPLTKYLGAPGRKPLCGVCLQGSEIHIQKVSNKTIRRVTDSLNFSLNLVFLGGKTEREAAQRRQRET